MNYIMNDNTPDVFAQHSTSSILSPVVAREMAGIGRGGEILPADGVVGNYTVRDGKPQFLGAVSDGYKIAQMRDLVAAAESEMRAHFTNEQLKSIEIKDRSAFRGAYVERRYTIKAFEEALTYGNTTARTLEVGTTVAAEMRLKTGYDGNTRTTVACGPIDLVCNNGLAVMTDVDAFSRKHTSGSNAEMFRRWIEEAIPTFEKVVENMRDWADTPVEWSHIEDAVRALPGVSNQRAEKLLARVATEVRERGFNFYAVVSGLTYYSSHNSIEFPVRVTGNDNVATTLATREEEVARWLNSAPMQQLQAA